jgi:hypothetical protein
MPAINVFTVSVAASLILSAVADASDAPSREEGSLAKKLCASIALHCLKCRDSNRLSKPCGRSIGRHCPSHL